MPPAHARRGDVRPEKGLGWPWLGGAFALLTALAAFGIGNMVQANSVADALRATFNVPTWMTGLSWSC
jgi:alanine or glycine:cation symporter, AGCS family